MQYKEQYERWLADPSIDENAKQELRAITDDEKEIEDRFYRDLAFGTGGMRGVIGLGTNRLNIYTIRKATQGLANYILSQGKEPLRVAIAHDCRRMSPEFTEEAALVLNGNGIETYVFESLRPTPVLSFAVRHLGCTAGIVITASHNPPEYNGYKVYWSDGGQTPYPRDEEIIAEVDAVKDFSQVKSISKSEAEAKGLFHVAGSELDDAYIACVKAQSIHPEIIPRSPIKIVFTPLHGTGNVPIRRTLSEMGFAHVYVVDAQTEPDGNFPTVKSPNPEDRQAFAMALEKAVETNADLVIATDPDCDRVGAAVKDPDGKYILLTGNMTGLLLTEYMLSQLKAKGTLPANGAVISTIVSTDMAKAITNAYGLTYIDVLTGFKYIGEKIKEFEESGDHTYIFGFEESYGCLAGTYARDKDAVVTTMLICEAAAYYADQGITLYNALEELYKKYGFYQETIESITLKGVEGLADMRRIMTTLREKPPKRVAEHDVLEVSDYLNKTVIHFTNGQTEATTLPVSDVLYFTLENGSWFCVRPSGTEPKIKLYFGVCVRDADVGLARREAGARLERLSGAVRRMVDEIL